jgi:hypothetical protein
MKQVIDKLRFTAEFIALVILLIITAVAILLSIAFVYLLSITGALGNIT